MAVRKWDVVDVLRRETGATRFAQIMSATTSPDMLDRPELQRFASVTTLSYASAEQRCEMEVARDLPDLVGVVELARRARLRAEIVFVDPWHTYGDSIVTMLLALEIVTPGGRVIVHDCWPCNAEVARPEPPPCGEFWCGST